MPKEVQVYIKILKSQQKRLNKVSVSTNQAIYRMREAELYTAATVNNAAF
jgi:hypothetical protein